MHPSSTQAPPEAPDMTLSCEVALADAEGATSCSDSAAAGAAAAAPDDDDDEDATDGEIRPNKRRRESVYCVWHPGWTIVLGGFLLQLTVGSLDCGDMAVYLSSFFRAKFEPNYDHEQATWIHSESVMAQGVSMILGGYLLASRRMSPRSTAFLGCAIATAGVLFTGLSMSTSPALVVFTYGIVYGVGTGIAYVVPLACSLKWYPNNPGLAVGFILSGFGIGSSIFSHIQTALVNPHGLRAHSDSGYFEDNQVLARVPTMFFVLGGIYAVLQSAGCVMLADPPCQQTSDEEFQEHKLTRPAPSSCLPKAGSCLSSLLLTRGASMFVKNLLDKKCTTIRGVPVCQAAWQPSLSSKPCFQRASVFVISNNQQLTTDAAAAPTAISSEDFIDDSNSQKQQCWGIAKTASVDVLDETGVSNVIAAHHEVAYRDVDSKSPFQLLQSPSKFMSEVEYQRSCSSRSSSSENSNALGEDLDLSPREAVQTNELHVLWITCLLSQQVVGCSHMLEMLVNGSLAKQQAFRQHSSTVVGPATCLLNSIGSIVWGSISDRFSYKATMMVAMGSLAVFLSTFWAVDSLGSPAVYAVWSIVVFSTTRSSVSLFPSMVYKTFGPKHFGMNYALVRTSTVVSQAVQSLVAEQIHLRYGVVGVMMATAVCTAGAFLITAFYVEDHSSPLKIRERFARQESPFPATLCFNA